MAVRNDALRKQLNQRVERHPGGSKEYWRDIPGYEGSYRISDRGRVKSLDRYIRGGTGERLIKGQILGTKPINSGYLVVGLSKNSKHTRFLVHRLVLEVFVGPCPPGCETRHFPDRSRTNNWLSNLSWGTNADNHEDRRLHGTMPSGEKNYNARFKNVDIPRIHSLYEQGYNPKEIGDILGTDPIPLGIIKGKIYKEAQPNKLASVRSRGCNSGEKNGRAWFITFGGETKILKDWAAGLGLNPSTLAGRIKDWGLEKALTTPRKRRRKSTSTWL